MARRKMVCGMILIMCQCYYLIVWAKKFSKQEYEKSKKKFSRIVEKQESLLKGNNNSCMQCSDVVNALLCFSVHLFIVKFIRVSRGGAENEE